MVGEVVQPGGNRIESESGERAARRAGGMNLGTAPDESVVPAWLERAAALGWRLLVVAAALLFVLLAISKVLVVVVPVVVALFLSTVLVPPARWLRRRGWPPALATWAVFLMAILVLAGIVALLAPNVAHDSTALRHSTNGGIDRVQNWLVRGPFHLKRGDVKRDFNNFGHSFKSNAGGFAVRGATLVGEIAADILLSLVLTFFFVKDGERMAASFLRLVPTHRKAEARELGTRTWATLSGYIRGTAVNGLVNGVLMTLGLFIIGVPLAGPIGMLTFFGGFFPIVGAIAVGALAALIALVAKGPVAALVVIGLTIVIHNVEGYLVGPLVLGRAVKLHPVAVLLALAVGGVLAGVIGAFVAVPTAAVIASAFGYYRPPLEPDVPIAE
jgi:predicted PurR-regulated permease PerM